MGCLCERVGEGLEIHHTCIGNVWIFADLSAADSAALATAAVRRRYKRADVIVNQGAEAGEMFLIKAGRVKLTKITADGEEITLDIRKGGDFIGENMLNEEMRYPVTATCIEDSLTCGFTKSNFERLVLTRPTIGLQVIKNLSKRIDSLSERIRDMSMTNLEDRLYRVLMNMAQEHGVQDTFGRKILFPLTHEELSFLAGAHRVSVTRAIKALKESGKVIQEGKNFIVQAV